jgi:hypothetical protein
MELKDCLFRKVATATKEELESSMIKEIFHSIAEKLLRTLINREVPATRITRL